MSLYANSIDGVLAASISDSDQTLQSTAFEDLPEVTGQPDTVLLTLDPNREQGLGTPEVVEVREHSPGSDTVEVNRARETDRNGGTAKAWPAGTKVVHAWTAGDAAGHVSLDGENTMTGSLDFEVEVGSFGGFDAVPRFVSDSGDVLAEFTMSVDPAGVPTSLQINVYESDGSNSNRLDLNGQGAAEVSTVLWADTTINGALDVTGSKNAALIDPDDPTRAWRFAAVESDRPGVLEHEAEVETGQTYSLPTHWEKLATNLRVTGLQPLDSQAGNAWPEINGWSVTVRGQPGRYWMTVRADRNDAGVANWQHEFERDPEDINDPPGGNP